MTASILKQDENTQNVFFKTKKQNPLILISQYNITEQYKFPLQAPFSGNPPPNKQIIH